MRKVKVQMTTMCINPQGVPTHREFSDGDYKALCDKFGTPSFGWYPIENGLIKAFYENEWRVFRTVRQALAA